MRYVFDTCEEVLISVEPIGDSGLYLTVDEQVYELSLEEAKELRKAINLVWSDIERS